MNEVEEMREALREQREYLGSRIGFKLDGWRRLAYWAAVAFLGVSFGIRYGHPDTAVFRFAQLYTAPTAQTARSVSTGLAITSIALIWAVVGRKSVIRRGDE